jgi:hypothetical protein
MHVVIVAVILSLAFLQPVYSQETSTVITQGIGKDVESAVQRGAEAALIQVVGSFIDSEKLIKKRKEIRNGIRTRTKSISSKISEYSQGSIERLDVLEVAQEDGLTRVTTKVIVRIEDFKRYIKETVLAERKIKTGLLAQLKTGRKQEKNLVQLLHDKIFRPILDYQVVVPKLSEISKVTDPKLVSLALNHFRRTNREFVMSDNEFLISFDVDVKLNPNYLQNALRVLDETAEKKYSCHNYRRTNSQGTYIFPKHSVLIGIGVIEGNQQSIGRQCNFSALTTFIQLTVPYNSKIKELTAIYGFPITSLQVCRKLFKTLGAEGRMSLFQPKIKLQFLSTNGNIINEDVLSKYKGVQPLGWSLFSDSSIVYRDWGTKDQVSYNPSYVSQPYKFPALISYSAGNGTSFPCSFFIKKSASFSIMTKVTEETLSEADKIVLSYIK